jgi:hypothetical protein
VHGHRGRRPWSGRKRRERGVLAETGMRAERVSPGFGTRATEDKVPRSVHGLLADGETGEAAYDDVLAGGGGELVAQLLDGLAVELRVVHLLLEQDDA